VPVNRSGSGQPASSGPPAGEPPRRGPEPGAPSRVAISDEMLAEAASAAGIDLEQLSPEERQQLEAMLVDMAEAQVRLASAPAAEIVVNHLGGLYELARIHLSQDPPNFDDAALAIDALTGVLDAIEDRLGPDGPALREAVSQLRLAFVQLRERSGTPS
jgi:hypothetical protein